MLNKIKMGKNEEVRTNNEERNGNKSKEINVRSSWEIINSIGKIPVNYTQVEGADDIWGLEIPLGKFFVIIQEHPNMPNELISWTPIFETQNNIVHICVKPEDLRDEDFINFLKEASKYIAFHEVICLNNKDKNWNLVKGHCKIATIKEIELLNQEKDRDFKERYIKYRLDMFRGLYQYFLNNVENENMAEEIGRSIDYLVGKYIDVKFNQESFEIEPGLTVILRDGGEGVIISAFRKIVDKLKREFRIIKVKEIGKGQDIYFLYNVNNKEQVIQKIKELLSD